MDARNDMLRLLHSRKQGYSLEQPFYTDAGLSSSSTWN